MSAEVLAPSPEVDEKEKQEAEKVIKEAEMIAAEAAANSDDLQNDTAEIVQSDSSEEKMTAGAVGITDDTIRLFGGDSAEARINREITDPNLGFLNRQFTRIWKGNWGRDYYREKYTQEAIAEIKRTGDLFAGEGVGSSESSKAAIAERFLSDLPDEEIMHSGEKRSRLEEDTEQTTAYKTGVRELIGRYARGEVDEVAFDELKDELLANHLSGSPELVGESSEFADNLLEIAQQVKLRIEHDGALDVVLDSIDFVVGEGRMGVRSEAHLTKMQQTLEKISSKHFKLITGGTLALITAATVGVGRRLAISGTSKALALTGIFGVAGAAISGGREYGNVTRQRGMVSRDAAKGKDVLTHEVDPTLPRWKRYLQRKGIEKRQRLDETTYDTVNAGKAAERLNGLFDEESKLEISSKDEFDSLLFLTAFLEQRIKMSDEDNIDLLDYSDITMVETERNALDFALAKMKCALAEVEGEYYEDETAEELLEMHESIIAGAIIGLEKDISTKDRLFNTVRAKEVSKAALKGAIFGGAMGFAYQEILGAIPIESIPGVNRLIGLAGDKRPGDGSNYDVTMAESLKSGSSPHINIEVSDHVNVNLPPGLYTEHNGSNWSIINPSGKTVGNFDVTESGGLSPSSIEELQGMGILTTEHAPTGQEFSGPWSIDALTDQASIKVPEGYSLVEANGGWAINDAAGNPVGSVILGQNGQLTPHSVDVLEANGFNVSEATELVSAPTVVEGLTPAEFMQTYKGTVDAKITRFWGNNTPGVADLNEIAPQAGGADGTWFDAEGNVRIDITGMTEDGSFSGTESLNPHTLVDQGELKFIVSPDDSVSGRVAMFDIEKIADESGALRTVAIIPKDDDMIQFFGAMDEGRRGFKGNWIMVGRASGDTTESGALAIESLSSMKGYGHEGSLTAHAIGSEQSTLIELAPVETQPDYFIEPLPVPGVSPETVVPIIPIPMYAATGLEIARYSSEQDDNEKKVVPGRITGPDSNGEGEEGHEGEDIPGQTGVNFTTGTFNASESVTEWIQPMEQISGDSLYPGFGRSEAEVAQVVQELSPRLQDNPEARLQLGQELSGYREQIRRTRKNGDKYLETVDSIIDDTPELTSLHADTQAIVTMPVDVRSSGDSVYQALSVLATQKGEALRTTTILVYGHYPASLAADLSDQAIPDYVAEIERFKADHPDVRIASVEEELSDEIANNPMKVPGFVGRHMVDTAMLAVERAIGEGKLPQEQDILLIRNNVDQIGMSLNYLERMIAEAEKPANASTDIFMGATHWNIGEQTTFAGLGVVTNFKEIMDAISTRKETDFERPTSGINTAVRMSAFAAVGGLGFGDYTGPGSDDLEIGRRIRIARQGGGQILRHVTSAQIDTRGSAVTEAYRRGQSITVALPTQMGQNTDGSSGDVQTGDLKDNLSSAEAFVPTLSRIEHNLSEMATDWYQDPGLVATGMRHLFGKGLKDGEGYGITWHNGRCRIKFTDTGGEWLRNSLRRNSKGQFDSYGGRKERAYYNIARGKISPNTQPRMAPATS